MEIKLAQSLMLFIAITCNVLGADAKMNTQDSKSNFMQKYLHNTNNLARRELVINAIDIGLIKRGMTIDSVQSLFDKSNLLFLPSSSADELHAVVYFTPAPVLKDPLMATAPTGWYLDLTFGKDKCLRHYSLSNLHK